MSPPEPKLCATCGRPFEWRAKWADDWDAVRHCSAGCRRHRPGPLDRRLEEAIDALLDTRGPGKSICPSEAARRVAPDAWRPLMERTRRAARRMAHAGRVEITRGGRAVDPGRVRGPIRIRRAAGSRDR